MTWLIVSIIILHIGLSLSPVRFMIAISKNDRMQIRFFMENKNLTFKERWRSIWPTGT